MTEARPPLAIICGPTGAGKSDLALALAGDLGGEIINADSLALYRGFDIGTAKPSPADLARVPHHLIDLLNPDEDFDAAAYLKKARPIVKELALRNAPALAAGGTGFYLRALTRGLFDGPGRDDAFRARLAEEAASGADLHARLKKADPESAARLAPADRVRIERALEVFHLSGRPISQWQKEHALAERPFRVLPIVVDRPVEELDRRLKMRTEKMIASGLAEEAAGLLKIWPPDLKPFGAIGYKEILAHLRGEFSLDECREKIYIATRRYAKRQRTWFKGQMPEALWFHPDRYEEILSLLKNFFAPGEVSAAGAKLVKYPAL